MSAIPQLLQSAIDHHRAGRLSPAEQLYRQILSQNPNHPDALHLFGLLALQTNHIPESIQLIEKAVSIKPNYPEAIYNLGNAYRSAGHPDRAVSLFQRALALHPNDPQILQRLAESHADLGQFQPAIQYFQQALTRNPNDFSLLNELALVLASVNRNDEAFTYFNRALAINPNSFEVYNNLANVHKVLRQYPEAIAAYQRALSLNDNADTHWNYALLSLSLGNYQAGWREFEYRLSAPYMRKIWRHFDQPIWHRQDLTGKTLLLHHEGGFGDSLFFIRYLPLIHASSGASQVYIECPAPLLSLFRNLPGPHQLIRAGDALPAFDYHCPLPSLPFNFNTTLDTIPKQVPYLSVSPDLVAHWSKRMRDAAAQGTPGADQFLKVGLAWSGSMVQADIRTRSLSTFAPLASIPNITFFSLQLGPESADSKSPPPGMNLIDLTPDIKDFSDTGALVTHLDLIISVDTSVAHLAGALAKPTWTLIPHISDFRWLLDRSDSPWYPTMTLFRQDHPTDWTSTIARLKQALEAFAQGQSDAPR